MTKQHSGVNTRSIGLELQRLRKKRGLSCAEVGEALGTSASTISRIENGKREATSEEVASILTKLEVKGVERERLIDLARRQNEPDLLERDVSTEQSRTFINFEANARKIIDFGLMIVPGLAQTAEYAQALLRVVRVRDDDDDLEPWMRLRMSRKALLTRPFPPELHWIITEVALRQQIGGGAVMARQVRHLIELSEKPNITINVLPAAIPDHPGLPGPFVIMEFDDDPTVVHVEDRTTGLFLDNPDKVELYMLTAQRLADLAMDEQASVRLMRRIAEGLE